MISASTAIDVHTHIIPPGWEDFAGRFGIAGWPSLRQHSNCEATIMLGEREFRKVTDQCFAPVRRIADMDTEQVGKQLISPIPIMLCYWGVPEATAAFARMQNDFIADVVTRHPDRFLGAGTVAMQSPAHAIPELERLKKMGFPAIEIGTHVNGRDLDDPAIVDVLAAAEALDIAVFVHPQGPSLGEERMKAFYLPFMVGYSADSALAIARLILGGVLERLPKLRICFSHGGGSFPAVLGRLDHGYSVRPEAKKFISRPPSTYAQKLYFDTLTHDPQMLELVYRKFGSHRIMLGSDYPFDMGVEHPLEQLTGVSLSSEDRDNILFKTAQEFLRLGV
jgi:aminocarboxymuconate-semialdehyde decarboxylase